MISNNKILLILLFASHLCQIACASTVEQQIVGVINELCPRIAVCNATGTLSTIPIQPGLRSCCTECSCSPSCSLTGDCCFKTTEGREYHRDQTCISTWSPTPPPEKQFLYSSYYMYTEPPTNGCVTDEGNRVMNTHLTLWRTLLPVYSKYTTKIYLNKHLAECHGEFYSTQWQTVASCDKRHTTSGNVFDAVANHVTYPFTNESDCQLHFRFPGDKNSIESERCYPELIDSCGHESFQVPSGMNMSQDDVRIACKGGFFSPYTKKANFANVFCYFCNRNPFWKNGLCKDYDDKRSGSGHAIDILLNPDVLRDMQSTRKRKNEVARKQACPNAMSLPFQKECRVVLCPKGRMRAQNGTCVSLFQALMTDKFGLFLKLVPKTPLSVDKINPSGLQEFPPWLVSPWPGKWLPYTLHYERTDDPNSQIKHIWVDQRIQWIGQRMDTLIQRTMNTIKRQWTASIGNETIELDQVIDVSRYFQENYYQFLDSERKVINDNIHPLYSSLTLYSMIIYITKPYFCDLVELYDGEFTTTHVKEAITYVRTNRTLSAAEYALRQNDKGQYKVMICFEDSGFVLRNHFSGGSDRIDIYKSMVIAFLEIWLLNQ